MKITKSQLKQLIKEELESVLAEVGIQRCAPGPAQDLRPATAIEYKQYTNVLYKLSGKRPAGIKPPQGTRDHIGEIPLPGDIPRGAWIDYTRRPEMMWVICPEAAAGEYS